MKRLLMGACALFVMWVFVSWVNVATTNLTETAGEHGWNFFAVITAKRQETREITGHRYDDGILEDATGNLWG